MEKRVGALLFFSGLLLGLILLFLILSPFGISVGSYLLFLLGLTFVVYIPGLSLCWLAKLKVGRMEMMVLASAMGLVISTMVFKIARWLDLDLLFVLWLVLTIGYFLWHIIKHPPKKQSFSFQITLRGVIFLGIVLLILISLGVDNYRNGIQQPDGSVVINAHYYDGFIRSAVVREVSHSVPPEMPFAAGLPLSYHYGMDLFMAIFHRYLNLNVFDIIHRLCLTWFFLLLFAALFIFIREMTASEETALLGAFLGIFGSGGFAYLVTYGLGIYQWGHIFYSFYFFNFAGINSLLPAFAILAVGFFGLSRYIQTRKVAWLWITALLFALVLEFKMFLLGPVVGALFLTSILCSVLHRDHSLWKVLLLTLFLATPLVLVAYLSNSGGPQYTFGIRFVDWIRWSLRDLKFTSIQLAWADLFHRSQYRLHSFLMVIPALLIFFAGSLGLGILAIPTMLKQFFSFRKFQPHRAFLIALFAGSVIYIFCMDMSFEGRSNNLVYVYKMGLVVLFAFWAELVTRFWRKHKTPVRIMILTGVVLLSIPNTVRFLWIKSQTPQPKVFSAAFVEAADWLNTHTEAEATILHPLDMGNVCYFVNRRVVLDNTGFSFIPWHLTAAQVKQRTRDIDRFFSEARLNAGALDTYDVAYIMIPGGLKSMGDLVEPGDRAECYIDLGTKTLKKYKKSHWVELVFKNSEMDIYKVEIIPEKHREVFLLEKRKGEYLFRKFRDKPLLPK